MATNYDKKKLIEESSDVYISDYDKNLDYSYLSDIIDQKRAYKTAQAAGDSAGMKRANDSANNIRLQAASYVGGNDGSAYNRVKRPYEEGRPQRAISSYEREKDRLYNRISSYGDFEYDVNSDPLYKAYKDIYLSLGDDAYERALSENSLRTGGVSNTSAVSAAAMAKNKYNTMLANIVPELYDKAYSKYRDGLADLYDRLEAVSDIDADEYSRYRDEADDYESDREYYYKKDRDIADDLYDIYTDETNMAYDTLRDEAEARSRADETAFDRSKLQSEAQLEKLKIAVNLAKALYGRVPVSANTVKSIMAMIG